MPEIKLWFSPGACSLVPHILLREIGASFEAIETPVSTGATLTEEFARINPKKRVPVLSLDGELITEVPAIATAISRLAPERGLMGRSDLETARVYEWMNWLSGVLHGQGFGSLWRPERFSDDPQTLAAIQAKGRKTIAECFDFIERKLTGLYATDRAFTAADPFLLVFYLWGSSIGVDMRASYPGYSAFASALVHRESVAAALAAERIDLSGA